MSKLSTLYTILFTLSLILINPWGSSRGEIWTQPKVAIISLIVVLNFWVIRQHLQQLILPVLWKRALLLWSLYLGVGLVATIFSPFPWRSFWGQSMMGDGWAYWVLIAIFMLSNALLLRTNPTLVQPQLKGLLIAGAIVAFSVLIQVFNWKIDFTITSGQVNPYRTQLLVSDIWQQQMPIGFYANRGYAGFVLTGIGILALVGMLRGWLLRVLTGVAFIFMSVALFFTQTRAAMLAFVAAIAYLFLKSQTNLLRQRIASRFLIGLLLISCLSLTGYGIYRITTTPPNSEVAEQYSPDHLEQFSTGRFHLWNLSAKGIAKRPLLGWGFNGFGIAHPYVADWEGQHRSYLFDKTPVVQITNLKDFTFDYLSKDGEIHTGRLLTNKAHNLLLDITLSTGCLGLLCYGLLVGFCFRQLVKTPFRGFEALIVVYLVFTFTWFDSAQFSHLVWWVLSIGLVSWRVPDPDKAGNYLLKPQVAQSF